MEYDWEKAARKKFLKMFPNGTIHSKTGLIVIGVAVAHPDTGEAAILELGEVDDWSGSVAASADIWMDIDADAARLYDKSRLNMSRDWYFRRGDTPK
tara:strand:+ start:251 stop:541 length:291 start_codon:yes stop_codon:yes gene_type:complete